MKEKSQSQDVIENKLGKDIGQTACRPVVEASVDTEKTSGRDAEVTSSPPNGLEIDRLCPQKQMESRDESSVENRILPVMWTITSLNLMMEYGIDFTCWGAVADMCLRSLGFTRIYIFGDDGEKEESSEMAVAASLEGQKYCWLPDHSDFCQDTISLEDDGTVVIYAGGDGLQFLENMVLQASQMVIPLLLRDDPRGSACK